MFSSNTSQVSNDAVFVEDVFSTYLYTGTTSPITINNGIDLTGKGGMVWFKSRNNAVNHAIVDTARSDGYVLNSNTTSAEQNFSADWNGFRSNGFSVSDSQSLWNLNGYTYASWTFRKQPKFFDVVTYTATGSNQVISHSLGSTPGFIVIKKTSAVGNWWCSHTSLPDKNTYYLNLNATDPAGDNGSNFIYNWTDTSFSVAGGQAVSDAGATYVAYLFAHNAGGFGLTGTDNVISCGSYTGNGSTTGPSVTLGYEPQWVLIKRASGGTQNWIITDNMRDFSLNGNARLFPNLADAESAVAGIVRPNATGFSINGTTGSEYNASGNTYIYIAIRRGPMKTPTSGTSVFSPDATSYSVGGLMTTNFPVDLSIWRYRDASSTNTWQDRLRGIPNTDTTGPALTSQSTAAETTTTYNGAYQPWNTGLRVNNGAASLTPNVFWMFRRAPGFFDEVCYTGTAATNSQTHNLGVAPELILIKGRNLASNWGALFNFTSTTYTACLLNAIYSAAAYSYGGGNLLSSQPTSSAVVMNSNSPINNSSGSTYVAYLFASCPGVSQVGTYTGTGATQTINCGFTGGARFVLIKRTDDQSPWNVWDTARGMVSGTDPRLALNSGGAEGTGNYVYSVTGGFQIVTSATDINANGGTYIYLAIA